jgi:hypothetical protein
LSKDPQTAAIVRKITRHLMPVLGIMLLTFVILPSGPEQARFLTADDKSHLRALLRRQEQQPV